MVQQYQRYDYESIPAKTTIKMMASLIYKITKANDCLTRPQPVTRFHARSIPTNITIQQYLSRILKYAPCSNVVFISILVYLDRLANSPKPFVVNSYNIHRFLIVAIMVSTKFFSDVFYTNIHYAKVGGVTNLELNQLELEFLFMLNFDLIIQQEEFEKYGNQLLNHYIAEVKMHEGAKNQIPSLAPPQLPQIQMTNLAVPGNPIRASIPVSPVSPMPASNSQYPVGSSSESSQNLGDFLHQLNKSINMPSPQKYRSNSISSSAPNQSAHPSLNDSKLVSNPYPTPQPVASSEVYPPENLNSILNNHSLSKSPALLQADKNTHPSHNPYRTPSSSLSPDNSGSYYSHSQLTSHRQMSYPDLVPRSSYSSSEVDGSKGHSYNHPAHPRRYSHYHQNL